jgi:hypothetical protein
MRKTTSIAKECLVCNSSHSTEEKFIQCVENNIDKVDWIHISKHQQLSESFIERFQDKVNWNWISKHQQLSEDFIEKFQDEVNWLHISIGQTLSENFIEKYQDKVDWSNISGFQQLSEVFIKRFQNRINWWCISRYQNFSKEFIEKILVKLNDLAIPSESHIKKYTKEIKYDIEIAIKRNVYQQQYKKHIITILQEDKIYLTEEFKNELFTLILSET